MKILFFIRSLHSGGSERQLSLLAEGLKNRGHSVSVVTMYPGGVFEQDLITAGVPVYSLDKSRRWEICRSLIKLRAIAQQIDPDLIHSYGPEANVFATLHYFLRSKCLLVWGIRNANSRELYGRFERILYWFEGKLSRIPNKIIANSNAGRELSISDGFYSPNFCVVRNGINTERYCPDVSLRESTRNEWSIELDQKVIGIVGRIDPEKDYGNFINMISCLPADVRCKLVFVCVGYQQESQIEGFKKKLEQLQLEERVVWIKHLSSTVGILNALDVLVSSSRSEGFANVIAEGMAVGVPCVVTDVGDSREIVSEYGYVAPARDPLALAAGIIKMLQDPRLGSPAFHISIRKHVVEKFSLDALVLNTESVFVSLLDQFARGAGVKRDESI